MDIYISQTKTFISTFLQLAIYTSQKIPTKIYAQLNTSIYSNSEKNQSTCPTGYIYTTTKEMVYISILHQG